MRLRKLVCLGGGLVVRLGSSSIDASGADQPRKHGIDDGLIKNDGHGHRDNGMRTDTTAERKPGGQHALMSRSMIDRGGRDSNLHWGQATSSRDAWSPTNICSIGSGTGCPYLVSTAEWTSLSAVPGTLLVTSVHDTNDADDGEGDEDGEGGESDNRGGSSFYGWPRRSESVKETEAMLGVRAKDIVERYGNPPDHGLEPPVVPHPVCLVMYFVVLLIAVYRGNPRRGLRRYRRIQRRARSSLYAKRRSAAGRNEQVGATRDVRCICILSFFGFCIHEVRRRLTDIGLFSKSGPEERNQAGDACLLPLDNNDTPIEEPTLLGTCEDVVNKSNLDPIASMPPAPPASKGQVETLGACCKVREQDSKSETAATPATNMRTLSSSVRIPSRPAQAVLLSRVKLLSPSLIDAVLDYVFCAGEKPEVKTGPTPPQAEPQTTAGKAESLGTSRNVANQNVKLDTANSPAAISTAGVRVPAWTPASPAHVEQLAGTTSPSASASNGVLTSSSSCAVKAPQLKPTATSTATSASKIVNVESPSTSTKAIKDSKQPGITSQPFTTTTPSLPVPARAAARPAQAQKLSRETSSPSLPVDAVLEDSPRATKEPNGKPTTTSTATYVSTQRAARKGDDHGNRSNGIKDVMELQTTGKATTTALPTVAVPVRTPARPSQAVQLLKSASSAPSESDVALDCSLYAAKQPNPKPASASTTSSVNDKSASGNGDRHGTCPKSTEGNNKKLEAASNTIAATPTVAVPVRTPTRPAQAAKVSNDTASASSVSDVVLDCSLRITIGPNRKPATTITAACVNTKRAALKGEDRGTCSKATEDAMKPETTSKATTTTTPTVAGPARTPARPARAENVSTIAPSAPSIGDVVLDISPCPAKDLKSKPAATAFEEPETASKPISDTPTVAVPVRTPAKPAEAVQLSTVTSPASSVVDAVFEYASGATKALNLESAASPTAGLTGSKAAGHFEYPGNYSKVVEQQKKLEAGIRATNAAASTPPTSAWMPETPTAYDAPHQDIQATMLSRATPQPPKKDNVVLKSGSGEAKVGPTILPPKLEGFGKLFGSRKPAILGILTWGNGYSIQIDPDGNCYGTSWMLTVLIWAAQRPSRLDHLIATLEQAGHPDNAFGGLDPTCKGYVDGLVAYITELRAEWNGHTEHDSSRGTHLALEVVRVFWGDLCTGYRGTEKEGEDPAWLKLKWGVAIASRALDAWTAASNGFEVDMVKLCKLGESVSLDFGGLHGVESNTPAAADVLRPGGSVGLLAGLVVETYSAESGRRMEDYTTFLQDAIKSPSDRTITGLAVHKAGLPHFDVLITKRADVIFFYALAATFDLQEPVDGDDAAALEHLRLRTNSQKVDTAEELKNFVPDDQIAAQLAAMKAYEDQQARDKEAAPKKGKHVTTATPSNNTNNNNTTRNNNTRNSRNNNGNNNNSNNNNSNNNNNNNKKRRGKRGKKRAG